MRTGSELNIVWCSEPLIYVPASCAGYRDRAGQIATVNLNPILGGSSILGRGNCQAVGPTGGDIDLVGHPLTSIEEPDRVPASYVRDIDGALAVNGARIIRGGHVMVRHALATTIKVLGLNNSRLRR